MTVAVPHGERFTDFSRRLRRDPAVARVEPVVSRSERLLPADPAIVNPDPNFTQTPGAAPIPFQWYLRREGFPQAWDLSRGTGVVVGVIDSGIDDQHPELQGKIVAVRDQDATSPDTLDQVGHGTHVAGTACAATNNQNGIAGAGFDCMILMEKSDLSSASVIASIVDAVNRGAKVINMSFGGGRESVGEQRAISYALAPRRRPDRGGLRHGRSRERPSCQGPSADRHRRQPRGRPRPRRHGRRRIRRSERSFAGRGSQISLAAYGDTDVDGPPGIFSTFPGGHDDHRDRPVDRAGARRRASSAAPTLEGDRRYAYLAGTSMAAPQVAGAAALVRAANPAAERRRGDPRPEADRQRPWALERRDGLGNPRRRCRGIGGTRADGRHRRAGEPSQRPPQPLDEARSSASAGADATRPGPGVDAVRASRPTRSGSREARRQAALDREDPAARRDLRRHARPPLRVLDPGPR